MPRLFAALVAGLMLVTAAPALAQTAPQHTATDVTVTNPDDGTTIAITVFQPATATADAPVPVILQSHGWGGSRTPTVGGEVLAFLNAGFGVVSIDQRGHGDSGGEANVQDPTKETEDIKAVIDYVASLDWVLHDRDAAGAPIADDPVLGAIGVSYGGGYQTMTALDEIADEGRTRFNALAPEITWYDLNESLAPQKVSRTAWVTLLYAVGAQNVPQYIHEAFLWGAGTGLWPDGTLFDQPAPGVPNLDAEFHKHGPVGFVERGIKIDVPVILRQGTSDNLFNLNQGLDIFQKALTDEARAQSYFVAFNGGHALPNVAPRGEPMDLQLGAGVDACSDDWTARRIDFFRKAFAGDTTGVFPNRYNFTNLDASGCLRFDRVDTQTLDVDLGPAGATVSTAGLGAPMQIELAQGPLDVTGVPKLEGTLTSLGLDNRAFFGLSVGTSPADAVVIQNNLMPLRALQPQVDAPFEIELPGVSAAIPEGQSLFLTITPVSDIYFGHGSRVPGAFVLSDLSVSLPRPVIPVATSMSLQRLGRGGDSRLEATLVERDGGAPVAGVPIRFTSGDKVLGMRKTSSAGVAILELGRGPIRKPGREFSATFAGTDRHEPASATTVAT